MSTHDDQNIVENHDPENESSAIAYKLGFEHGRSGGEPEHKHLHYLTGHEDGKRAAKNHPTIYGKTVKEEVNSAGGGAVAGIGVGADGEPGVKSSKYNAVNNVVLSKILRRKVLRNVAK